ncbi:putative histone-lysine N-methyltransferase PRDM6 [Corticium candelabrum]|uniref:putative histone-lysine N-methyltransferase PRDM6 n=1 Tax=Corticium candelabrum TaxID=121492 RepID=UPI002E261A80|nr:putative histone-lysine N-methyltransferase PRDM6 [Corticium candelabrum]
MTEQHISSTNLIHYLYGQNDSEPVDAMSVILQMNQNREKSDSSQQDAPTAGNPLLSLQRFVEETPTDDSDVLPYSLSSFPTEFGLCKSGIPGATFGVYAKVMIPLGTWIGPYEGKVSVPQAEEDQDDQLWEVTAISQSSLISSAKHKHLHMRTYF